MWRIFQAYVFYLIKIGKVPESVLSERSKKFKMSKFINEINLFSKDKGGMNISVLIVQILYAIAEKDYSKSSDRIEGIVRYCSRYLKDDATFRSNCFIKMLLQVPQARFHREASIRKTERIFKQLQTVPLESASQAHEIEIVPYEVLWQMVLDSLDLKIWKGK